VNGICCVVVMRRREFLIAFAAGTVGLLSGCNTPPIIPVDKHKGPAWLPVALRHPDELSATKFGGAALIPEGTEWPSCPYCKKPLKHALQLHMNELPCSPAEVRARHIESIPINSTLQLFLCSDWECLIKDDMKSSTIVRVIDQTKPASKAPAPKDLFPSMIIRSWTKTEERSESSDGETGPMEKDKLFGIPNWVQVPRQVVCDKCKKDMVYFFQIVSKNNLPIQFGDAGIGYIFLCPRDWSGAFVFDSH
jgi:hypothetical protein